MHAPCGHGKNLEFLGEADHTPAATWELLRGHRDKTQNRDIYRIYRIYRGKDPPKTTANEKEGLLRKVPLQELPMNWQFKNISS